MGSRPLATVVAPLPERDGAGPERPVHRAPCPRRQQAPGLRAPGCPRPRCAWRLVHAAAAARGQPTDLRLRQHAHPRGDRPGSPCTRLVRHLDLPPLDDGGPRPGHCRHDRAPPLRLRPFTPSAGARAAAARAFGRRRPTDDQRVARATPARALLACRRAREPHPHRLPRPRNRSRNARRRAPGRRRLHGPGRPAPDRDDQPARLALRGRAPSRGALQPRILHGHAGQRWVHPRRVADVRHLRDQGGARSAPVRWTSAAPPGGHAPRRRTPGLDTGDRLAADRGRRQAALGAARRLRQPAAQRHPAGPAGQPAGRLVRHPQPSADLQRSPGLRGRRDEQHRGAAGRHSARTRRPHQQPDIAGRARSDATDVRVGRHAGERDRPGRASRHPSRPQPAGGLDPPLAQPAPPGERCPDQRHGHSTRLDRRQRAHRPPAPRSAGRRRAHPTLARPGRRAPVHSDDSRRPVRRRVWEAAFASDPRSVRSNQLPRLPPELRVAHDQPGRLQAGHHAHPPLRRSAPGKLPPLFEQRQRGAPPRPAGQELRPGPLAPASIPLPGRSTGERLDPGRQCRHHPLLREAGGRRPRAFRPGSADGQRLAHLGGAGIGFHPLPPGDLGLRAATHRPARPLGRQRRPDGALQCAGCRRPDGGARHPRRPAAHLPRGLRGPRRPGHQSLQRRRRGDALG